MVLTREASRTRWLILLAAWSLVGVVAVWHLFVIRDYIALLDGAVPATANATPLRRPVPGSFSDSHVWVQYAVACQEGAPWQVRHTDVDNTPHGRQAHWNSVLVHLVSLAGRVQQAFTGGSLPHATENALTWFNLPLLLACVIGFSLWVARRAGAGAGVLVACGIIGLRSFYDGFTPNYVDHHGVLTACAFGLMLGIMLMGAGWWRAPDERASVLPGSPAAARRAAIVSALAGAVGMWVSAASTIPVIGIAGAAGLMATLLFGPRARAEGATFEPALWRLWGRTGAIGCVVFYAIEYVPSHIGLRLEVNHPFHALAWWGGAELIAFLAEWRLAAPDARPRWLRVVPALAALSVSPLTVAIFGTAAFMVRDPFVADLRHTVQEGMSFRAATQDFGSAYALRYLIYFLLAGASLVLLGRTKRDRLGLSFAVMLLLAFVAMSCWEVRWWLTASAAFLCLWLVIAAVLTAGQGNTARWAIVGVMSAILLPFGAIAGGLMVRDLTRNRTTSELDALEPLYRDIAAALRTAQPTGDIRLFASPSASTGIGYYGHFKTLGTLYWENTDGLKAAAAIYCAQTDDEALQLLRARGITHVAMLSSLNYVHEYFRLFRPDAAPSDVEKTFGYRLFMQQQAPRWLRALPYRPPSLAVPNLSVLLFQIAPDQSEADARWNLANAQVMGGNAEAAEANFRTAIAQAPAARQPELYKSAADLMYQYRVRGPAIRLYRAALALEANVWIASNLAWVLATSTEAGSRNGREALALAEAAWRTQPNDVGILNTFAAALAENGRFADAVTVATRAAELYRATGDAKTLALLQQRVEWYRSGRPWRD